MGWVKQIHPIQYTVNRKYQSNKIQRALCDLSPNIYKKVPQRRAHGFFYMPPPVYTSWLVRPPRRVRRVPSAVGFTRGRFSQVGPARGVDGRRLPAALAAAQRVVAHGWHAVDLDQPLVLVAGQGGDDVGGAAAE